MTKLAETVHAFRLPPLLNNEGDRSRATRIRQLHPLRTTRSVRAAQSGDPGYTGALMSRFGAAVNSMQNPAYQAGTGGAPLPSPRATAGWCGMLRIAVPAAVALSMGGHRRGVGLQSVPDADAEAAARYRKTSSSPGPRSRWNRRISQATRPTGGPTKCGPRPATQDVTDPDHVDLKTLRAKFFDRGSIDGDSRRPPLACSTTRRKTLDLHKDIFLQTSSGYEARLSQAFVDMAKNTVTSEEHVDVKTDQWNAQGRPLEGFLAVARWYGSKAMW